MNNNLSLYKLTDQYVNLLSCLYNPETGEVDEEIDKKIGEVEQSTEKKCIAVASWIRKMESEKREIESIKQEVLQREQLYEKQISKWEMYLKNNMERCGIKEVKCAYFTLRVKTNPYSTEIVDQAQIPSKYIVTREIVRTEEKPDKNAIKEEFIKTGIQIPGTIVKQNTKLEILIDKI